jgi:hypothetical protein
MIGFATAAAVSTPQALRLGRGAWWRDGALFDADFATGRFAVRGRDCADAADWLAGIGGTDTGSGIIIGPVIAEGAVELVTNGSFDATSAGWIASNGGTLSVVDGELRLSGGGGNTTALYQGVHVEVGRAYRFAVRQRRVGGAQNPNATWSPNAGLGGVSVSSIATSAATSLEAVTLHGSANFATMYVGSRQYGNPDAPTNVTGYDDASVQEVVPLAGWRADGLALQIEAVTAASTGSDQVLVQADDDAVLLGTPIEGNRVRVVWGADGRLRVIVTTTTTTAKVTRADVDLGVLAADTAVTVSVSMGGDRLVVQRDDEELELVTGLAARPGIAALRIGRGHAGAVFGGSIGRVTAWAGERLPRSMVRADGDSFMSGAGGVVLATTLADSLGRPLISTAAGGSDMAAIAARIGAPTASALSDLVTIVWDGSPNGLTSVVDYLDTLAAGLAAIGHHRFVVIPPIVPHGVSAVGGTALTSIAIRDGMMERWAGNVIDWRDWIGHDDGVIRADRMLNHPADAWHLNQLAMDEMAAGTAAFLADKYW